MLLAITEALAEQELHLAYLVCLQHTQVAVVVADIPKQVVLVVQAGEVLVATMETLYQPTA
jgi:hypothetical protein